MQISLECLRRSGNHKSLEFKNLQFTSSEKCTLPRKVNTVFHEIRKESPAECQDISAFETITSNISF